MDAPTPRPAPPNAPQPHAPRALNHLGARIRHLAQLAASEHHARLLSSQARAALAHPAQSSTEARA
jgi:hypothetical protein